MYLVIEIKDSRVTGSWNEASINSAIEAIEALKITSVGKTYSIISENGTVEKTVTK